MAIMKEYSIRIKEPHQPRKNPGDLIAIMTIYGIWGMSTSHKVFFGNHNQSSLSLCIRHVLWVKFFICCLCFCKVNFFGTLHRHRAFYLSMKDLLSSEYMRIVGVESAEMVGEHCRKEPVGEVEKWRSKGEFWDKLEKGGIARYIAKLHGFD